MQSKTTRIARLLVTLALLTAGAGAVTGCGGEEAAGNGVEAPDTGQEPQAKSRARQVADAWDGSEAARQWRKGYYPMADAVQLPAGGLRDKADQRAFTTQNFVLRATLPALPRGDGKVRWTSGASLTLPLVKAREAYGRVARGGNDGPHLTVTGVKPGEMTLATSRGPATVPAWLFTLEGYDTPLKRAAVGPSKLPEPPIGPSRDVPADTLVPLDRLVEVAGDGRSVTVLADHGACDSGPAVHVLETGTDVVLSASVLGVRKGPCTAEMIRARVTVTLTRPLGDRILLDAHTGRPVPHEGPHASSPSWS
ncbi:hypothetical protein [Streptomyces olivochromogenes]|uniref:Lipoprotein n=1 Tax=Streptomyces olivochromogenes TaxID=1963 RepID=A0A250VFF4_STROL|nr:hypothetical protein [Streptomyces olivochromogenes]KUN47390.1 hypothetical protein AQJ27_10660 [Streptomyces olivochromogenes]GAX52804.1 hypothetical protein SO3561_04323 [Streptomyces olivochromogenes]